MSSPSTAYFPWFIVQSACLICVFMLGGIWSITDLSNTVAAACAVALLAIQSYCAMRMWRSALTATFTARCILLVVPVIFACMTALIGMSFILPGIKPLV